MKTPENISHGIYLHIPFCLKKCAYCDFYSLTDLTLRQPFVDALLREMERVNPPGVLSDTLYFGGGTPSVLTADQITALMQKAQSRFTLAPDTEFTMEVNPGTVTLNRLRFLKQIGINRLNIGVQSFSDDTLKFLGRIHTPEKAIQTIEQARKVGFDNIGLDLMFGIPGQDTASWQDELNTTLALSPEHLSCYILSFEKATPLGRQRKAKVFKVLSERRVADLFRVTQQVLKGAGYEQYEISNYAKINRNGQTWRSRHNQKYWSFAPYTGLGPSAHTYAPPTRYWNVRDVGQYVASLTQGQLPIQEKEKTTTEQQITETIFLGLRTSDGIDMTHFEKKFQVSFNQKFGNILQALCEENLVNIKNNRCALTPEGMLFHDSIVGRLLIAHRE